jgi:hypothetical protein
VNLNELASRLTDLFKGMSVQNAWQGVQAFVAHPKLGLKEALFGLSVVMLVVLAILLFILYIATPAQKRVVKVRRYRPGVAPPGADAAAAIGTSAAAGRPAAPQAARSKRQPGKVTLFLGSTVGLLLILLFVIVAVYAATSTSSYCSQVCHARSKTVIAAVKTDHASCVSCHEERGVVGVVGNSTSRLRMSVSAVTGLRLSGAIPVQSSACLSCHSRIVTDTITTSAGLRISHKEIIAAGKPCNACHPDTGHVKRSYSRGMGECIVCHDGKTASAECSVCHLRSAAQIGGKPGQPADELGSGRFTYVAVNAANQNCAGCHDVANKCDPCHGGVRMPHTAEFIAGGHAMPAAFDGKQKCWKCHDPATDCVSPCHQGFSKTGVSGHAQNWKSDHATNPRDSGCACHANRTGRTTPYCPVCHPKR